MTQEMINTVELHEKLRHMYHERIQPKKISAVKTRSVTQKEKEESLRVESVMAMKQPKVNPMELVLQVNRVTLLIQNQ